MRHFGWCQLRAPRFLGRLQADKLARAELCLFGSVILLLFSYDGATGHLAQRGGASFVAVKNMAHV